MESLHKTTLATWFASSPPVAWMFRQLRELLIGALRQGPIPRHVAFVMDGNRRFARTHHIETVEGHNLGFEALARILEVCYKTGVEVVTIYAFSIENFKRSKYEVDSLMEMAKTKLEQLAQHGQLLERYGASIRILGQRELVDPEVIKSIERAEALTAHNDNTPLTNPTHPKRTFSASHITQSIRRQMLEVIDEESEPSSRSTSPGSSFKVGKSTASEGHSTTATAVETTAGTDFDKDDIPNPVPYYLDLEQMTERTLSDNMLTAGAPPLDLLVRTSGVQRLSDFMLWQCHQKTSVVFLDCLWPDFDLWHFLPVLVEWQWQRKKLSEQERGSRRIKTD
ncbi:Decaprenyl diphosphate synthase-like protein [Massariosphaeria phaeospora]|uniref:Alkyl transferase n=1 Tax=Massariosphaeria phaeospora TaxID=100035 RepID=A0A7C8I1P4_9PLEO|nr:Decaprenyl diphosphate synthase-like protein [Massariosphaeria phaeospora]